MARQIEAYKLRTEIGVDASKGRRELQATEKDVGKVEGRFKALGKEINASMKSAGVDSGKLFGREFSTNASSLITGSIKSLGTTLGSVIGTTIAPGIGTAVGSTVGSAVDYALEKVSGPVIERIQKGIQLNKLLEETRVEFTTFSGSEKEAVEYLDRLKKLSIDNGLKMGVLVEASERTFDFAQDLKLVNTIMRASIEQAADFGGTEEAFRKVADALGLIAEKGELGGKELQKLYRLGINAPQRLAESTGLSVKTIKRLMAEGRLDGAVAARLISESIIREKSGFAEKLTRTTPGGAERRFEAVTEIRAAEGTQRATRAMGDFFKAGGDLLAGPQAEMLVRYFDQKTGEIIDIVKKAAQAGVSVAAGMGTGITSGESLQSLGASFTSLGNWTEKTLKGVFEIQSPSERTKREIGVPIGEGIADGVGQGFVSIFKGKTTDEIVDALEGLLQDPRVRAFFQAIKRAEGGDTNLIVGGRRFSDLSHHPNVVGMRTSKGASTAAGSFQITGTNWRRLQKQLGLPDFTEHSQQLAALKLFADREGGAGLRALLSGNLDQAMRVAAKDWTSTPGSTIGGGGQRSKQQWMGYFNNALGSISDSNPMPVKLIGVSGGAGAVPREDVNGGAGIVLGQRQAKDQKDYVLALSDADGAVVNLTVSTEELLKDGLEPGTLQFNQLMNAMEATWPTTRKLAGAQVEHADASIALTEKYQEAARKSLVVGVNMLDQLSRAIGAAGAMIPSQQVGKKRGLFSKILGIAAPFLSFIPGVGPILSTVAGIASSALGGDYGGAASGVAGGFASGGVFRSSGGSGSGNWSNFNPGFPHRALGGPVRRGQRYLVGEHRPEIFEAPRDGWIHPRVGQGMGGGSSDPEMLQVLGELRTALQRFKSMPADRVVMTGAHGMLRAMDRDAGLIRLMGRRQRLP